MSLIKKLIKEACDKIEQGGDKSCQTDKVTRKPGQVAESLFLSQRNCTDRKLSDLFESECGRGCTHKHH